MATDHNFRIKNGLHVQGGTATFHSVNNNSDLVVGGVINTHDSGSPARITTSSTGQLYLDSTSGQDLYLGWWNSSSANIITEMKLRAPALYDRNNTSYYVNPATNSVLNDIDMRGTNTKLPGHAYSNTHDNTNTYWHIGLGNESTNHVLNLRVFNSSNSYVNHRFMATGADIVGNLNVTGNLTVTGSIDRNSVTDLDVVDKTITLGVGQTEANSGDSGIIIDGSGASLLWNESGNRFGFNKPLHVTGQVEATTYLQGATVYNNGNYTTLNTGGNGWDIVIARNGGSPYADMKHSYRMNGTTVIDSSRNIIFSTDSHQLTTSNANNISARIGTTGAAGLHMEDSGSNFKFQIYGDGTNYGFLNSEWGSWNLKKVTSGALYFNNNNSYYIQPESTSYFNTMQAAIYKIGTTTVIDASRNISANTSVTVGNSSTAGTLRAHYSDGSSMALEGYGLVMNRGASYIRPTTDNDKTLYIGGADATLDWLQIHFRTGTGLYMTGTRFMDSGRNLTNIGTISSGAITARADTDALFIKSVTNQNAAEIAFSSQGPSSYAQVGRISYQHGDTLAYGGTDVFTIGTTETAPRILADGLLMFKSGLALKPVSGTGAGTTLITSGRALQNITTISSGVITVNGGTTNVVANFISTDGTAGIKLQDSAGNVELSANGSTFRVQPSGGAAKLTVDASGNTTALGYLQHYGVIYSRDNLNVLNAAGDGWHAWATRVSGNMNLSVGSIVAGGALTVTGSGTFRYSSTDQISLSPTSTGGVLNVRNSSGTSVAVLDGRGTPFIDVTGNLKVSATQAIQKSGNYMIYGDGSGNPALYAGNTADNRNYYQATYHRWRSDDATTPFAELSSTGLIIGGTATPAQALHVEGNARINRPDLGGAPGMTALLEMYGYEGRGVGIKMRDSVNSASNASNREWFVGTGYAQSGFNIGYSSTGSQSSYAAQNKLALSTDGNLTIAANITNSGNINTVGGYKIGGITVIDSSRNLTDIGTIATSGKATIDNAVVADSLHIRGDAESGYTEGSMVGGISLWGSTGQATSNIMFKPTSSGSLGNHGFCTDSYNTYFAMDTTNRGWVFRNSTTDTNVASISNTGGIAGVTVRASNAFQIGTNTVIDANRQIFAKTGTQVGEDGTYGGYGVLGFGGITNGFNRIFGRDDTNDGLFLAAATGRKVFVRSNGLGSDALVLGEDDNYGGYSAIGFGNQLQNGYNRVFGSKSQGDGLYLASATGRGIAFRTNGSATNTFNMTSAGGFQVGTTTILDASRNLTNIGTISSADHTITSGTGGTNTTGLLFKNTDNTDVQAYIKKSAYYMHYNSNQNEGHHFTYSGTVSLLRLHGGNNGTRPNSVDITAANGLYMNNIQVMTQAREINNVTLGSGTAGARFHVNGWHYDTGNQSRFYFEAAGRTFYRSNNGHQFRTGTDATDFNISNNGHIHIASNGDSQAGSTEYIKAGGVAVLTSSRQLQNVELHSGVTAGSSSGVAPAIRGTAAINSSGYTHAFKVDGGGLASQIRFTVGGTTGNVVINNDVFVSVNHSYDILVESTSGFYTLLTVKIVSNGNEDFSVFLKTNHANTATVSIVVFPLNDEVITFTSTDPGYSTQTLEHVCERGKAFSSADSGAGRANMSIGGNLAVGDGTASLPSLSFGSDQNTGLYRSASDNLGFAIGGTAAGFFSTTQFNVTPKIISGTDMRAPIFYDNDNTAYYTSPNTTSIMNSVYMGTALVVGATAAQSAMGQIAVASSGNPYISFHGGGDTTRDAYFQYLTDHDRFYHGEVAYTETAGSYRAPIFYDSNDTGYYVNPAASSKMVYLGLAVDPYQSGSYRLNMGGHIHMNNNDIDHVNQLHFNAGVRFFDEGNDQYLNYKWADTGAGGIKFVDGDSNVQGYVYGHSENFGLLSADGSWAVQTMNSKTILNHRLDTPIIYDQDDTAYFTDLSSSTDSIVTRGTVHIGPDGNLGLGDLSHPKIAYPGEPAQWGGSGTTTGQIIIDLPGTLANYDMAYIEIDVFEYDNKGGAKIIIGSHNWNSGADSGTSNLMWYATDVRIVGRFDHEIYLGWRNNGSVNKRVIVLGTHTSSWSYGTVHVSKVHGATYYTDSIDWTGDWNISQSTSSSAYTKSPTTNWNDSDSRNLRVHRSIQGNRVYGDADMRSPHYYDLDNTAYYTNPAGTSQMNGIQLAGSLLMTAEGASNIKTRFIMGKASGNTGNGQLYLNYGTNWGVYIGAGGGGGSLDVAGSITAGGAITASGTLHVNQANDTNGIKIFGYDDRSAYSGNIYIDTNGNLQINQTHGAGSGYIQIHAENYLSLTAGSLVYTTSQVRIYDAGQLSFGTSGDYKIKHNTTADNLIIHTDDNKGITIDNAGNVTLDQNVYIPDAKDLNIGTGSGGYGDIIIMHDPDASRGIGGSNTTGTNYFFCGGSNTVFFFDGNEMHFTNGDPSPFFGYGNLMHSGMTNAFYAAYNKVIKFSTTNTGIQVTGKVVASAGVTIKNSTGADTEMYATGTGTSTLNIRKPSTSPHFQLSSLGALTIGGSLTQNSDRNIKDNIKVISDSLNKVSLLNGSTYTRIDEGQDPTKIHAGLIAQDVELALPEAVGETEDGIKTVDYSSVVALLVESVKSLTTEVNNLKKEIIELKNL